VKRKVHREPRSCVVDRRVTVVGRVYVIADDWKREGELLAVRSTMLGLGFPLLVRHVERPL
jgi:hypothetical protein